MSKDYELKKDNIYEIQIKGDLGSEWSAWFDDFQIISLANDGTLLVGQVVDQPALHGVLAKIRDLGLEIIRVERRSETKL